MADELRRSWMFVPGHRQKMIDKALGLSHIDALMLDIEDGVPQQEKQAARQQIGASLTQERAAGTTPARFVRVSAATHEYLAADLSHIVQPGLDGLVLPKIETPTQIQKADEMLSMGFIEDIEAILAQLPESHQSALFSATIPPRSRRSAVTGRRGRLRSRASTTSATRPSSRLSARPSSPLTRLATTR